MKLTLNISPCPNDTFMFEALINGRVDTEGLEFDLSFEDIENLNAMAIDGHADISKISYAILPQLLGRYLVLDSGSALGYGNGPLVVAREQLDLTLEGLRVVVPGEHTTANLLMSIIFPNVVDKSAMLFSQIADVVADGDYDAGVLIHEGRFTYAEKGLLLVADLGREWELLSGLPLPLGAIVVRSELPTEISERVNRVVRRSVEYAMENRNVSRLFVKEHAQELDDEVIDNHIEMFVNQFSVSLGEEGKRAVSELTGVNDNRIFV